MFDKDKIKIELKRAAQEQQRHWATEQGRIAAQEGRLSTDFSKEFASVLNNKYARRIEASEMLSLYFRAYNLEKQD